MEKKLNCEIVDDLLLGYLDETLNDVTKELVKEHLSNCDDCKKKLEDFRASILETKSNDKKCIDYLKKAKRKERFKTVRYILIIVLAVLLIMYLRNCIIFNRMLSKANKNLNSNNIYIQKMENQLNNDVIVTKRYYKDGKYKEITETYSENDVTTGDITYAAVDSDEIIRINDKNKRITIHNGDFTKTQNSEFNLKFVPFIHDDRMIFKLLTPSFMFINSQKFNVGSFSNIGKKCYVLKYAFEKNKTWEIWLDKETGLPLKEINIDGISSYYASDSLDPSVEITQDNVRNILKEQNDILKESGDSIDEYKYEFNIVTDDDVKVPDINSYSDYEIIYDNT